MKKYAVGIVIFVLLFIVGLVAVLQAAEITNLEGNVQVQSSADKAWKKANIGTIINIGDSIQTARSSVADVALDSAKKNVIRVEESTLVVINSTDAGEINRLDLSHGKIYANVEELKAGLAFEVKTPSAVAGVRGTGWSVDSKERNDEVAAFKDDVYVKSFDQQGKLLSEIIVPEGFRTLVERFEKAGELMKVREEQRERFNEMRGGRLGGAGMGNREIERVADIQQDTVNQINDAKEGAEQKKIEEVIEQRIENPPCPPYEPCEPYEEPC